MARNKNNKHRKIIAIFAKLHPETFSLVSYKVKPLTDDILGEIFYSLGAIPQDYKDQIGRAVRWYQSWPSYLQSVAFGNYKVNLAGNKMGRPSISEREAARDELKLLDLWTKRMNMVFKVNMGRKEAANR